MKRAGTPHIPKHVDVRTLGNTSSFNYEVFADGVPIRSFDSRFFAKRYARRLKKKGIPPVGKVVYRA